MMIITVITDNKLKI